MLSNSTRCLILIKMLIISGKIKYFLRSKNTAVSAVSNLHGSGIIYLVSVNVNIGDVRAIW